jgi:hypothetical protein
MLVFSSELMIRSKGSSRSPCQEPSYRSSTTAALVKKSAARGKIQCSYCQGLIASASRISQTVVRPMGLFNSSCARLARSLVDWRLKGFPVRATTSQAMDAMMALSRGGKDRLAATSGSVLEGKLPTGPAFPPEADRVGVQVEASSGCHVGKRGSLMQEQDQVGALPEVGRSGASRRKSSRLGEELVGEGRVKARERPRHETAPRATGRLLASDDALTIPLPRNSATLQLFAEWTT